MSAPNTIRSLHLLSDKKFLPWIKRTFSLPNWSAFYIVLNPNQKNYSHPLEDNILEVSADEYGEKIILESLHQYDIAFHYFLDNMKAEIIAKSANKILHYWCFYGAEVYQQTSLFRNELYGVYTKRILRVLPEIRFRYDLRKFYYKYILFKKAPVDSLQAAIPHIHAILWYVEEEVKLIGRKINLPPWQFFQFFNVVDIIPPGTKTTNTKSKKILIGNSATIENNHADVLPGLLEIIDKEYTFSLPMTYGQFARYKTRIKTTYSRALNDRVTYLEEHLELDEYYQFLHEHPTAIFLHYRQQALGNILYLLYTGTKVYLSENNIIYTWLIKHDIEVFKFEEAFQSDVSTNQLTLDHASIAKNQQNIMQLLDHQRNDITIRAIENEIFSRKNKQK